MSTTVDQSTSLANRWLRIASSSSANPQLTIEQRELARRSDLIAWLSLGMLGGLVIVSPIAIGDGAAALAYLCFLALLLATISLNRAGRITLSGIVLVASLNGAIFAYMWSSPLGLTMGQLPNYDALAVSVVMAASVLPRRSAFVVALLTSAMIVADYLVRPHNANIAADAALYPSPTIQTVSLLVRPIALQFIFALVAFLWVRGTDRAIRRADRAEVVAALEYRELERTRTLEEGVYYLRQTLAQWAEGNFTHRIPIMPIELLEQIRSDLNTYIERYSPIIDASYYLRRLQGAVAHLTATLETWVRGQPVVWPEPTGTPLDRAIELLRSLGPFPSSYSSSTSTPIRPTGTPRFSPGTMPPASPTPPRTSGAPPYMPPSQPFAPQPPSQPFGSNDVPWQEAPQDDPGPGNHWP